MFKAGALQTSVFTERERELDGSLFSSLYAIPPSRASLRSPPLRSAQLRSPTASQSALYRQKCSLALLPLSPSAPPSLIPLPLPSLPSLNPQLPSLFLRRLIPFLLPFAFPFTFPSLFLFPFSPPAARGAKRFFSSVRIAGNKYASSKGPAARCPSRDLPTEYFANDLGPSYPDYRGSFVSETASLKEGTEEGPRFLAICRSHGAQDDTEWNVLLFANRAPLGRATRHVVHLDQLSESLLNSRKTDTTRTSPMRVVSFS